MMALTHGFMGLALAVLALPVVSEHVAPLVLLGAFLGGLVPDLDVVARHRRSLHYPIGYATATAFCLVFALLTGTFLAVLATVTVGAAALHSLVDILGGSVERAPWDPTTERAVYNHVVGVWHRPRRYVRYSGAPEDFLLCGAFAAVVLASPVTTAATDAVLASLVACAGLYTLGRKRLHRLPGLLAVLLPGRLRAALPAVRVAETEDGTTIEFDRRI